MSKLLTFLPLLIELNQKEKRAIGIIAAIVLCVFLLLGLLVRLLLAVKDRKGRKIDEYMYDLVQYNLITTPVQFRSYVFRRESKNLYLFNRWYIRILILTGIGLSLYVWLVLKGDFSVILQIAKEFFPVITWPTTEMFGIQLISDWPQLAQRPIIHPDLNGFITYLAMLVTLIVSIKLICSAFVYYAKIDRSNKMSSKAFGKNLDNLANGGGQHHGFD